MALAQRGPAVLKLAVDHVRRRDELDRVSWHIAYGDQTVRAPVAHPTEDRREVSQYVDRVLAVGENRVDREPGLHAAVAVWDQLVAVPADLVERPLVDVLDICADNRVGRQIVEGPGRVIRPSLFEQAVPHPCVGAGQRVIVARHVDYAELHVVGAARHRRTEQRCVQLDANQRAVWVAQLGVDDFGQRCPGQLVCNPRGVAVRRNPAYADIKRSGAVQRNPIRPLVCGVRFTFDRVGNQREPSAAAVPDVDGDHYRAAIDVAGLGIGACKPLHLDRDNCSVDVRV